jgi:hypothetical protein
MDDELNNDPNMRCTPEYFFAVHGNFVRYLARRYNCGEAREIAGLCDEDLDRSGALLGAVRAAAAILKRPTTAQ